MAEKGAVAVVSSFGYESFFGLLERPFSLTPDSKYYFRSRSHARAFDALTAGFERRERIVLVTGDLGVGKTTLCRALAQHVGRSRPLSVVSNPLLAPEELLRLVLQDFGAFEPSRQGRFTFASRAELDERLQHHLQRSEATRHGAVLIVDEAQRLPMPVVTELLSLSALVRDGQAAVSLILVGQSAAGEASNLAIRNIDRHVSARIALTPLDRDECAAYVEHRLAVASAAIEVRFSPRAIDTLFALSGGVPRLVNLLCERALQEGALAGARSIEPHMVEVSAAELEIRRARPRRFRWFSKKIG